MGTKVYVQSEICMIVIVSIHLMLLYAAMNPACAFFNTTLEDSPDKDLTATVGYLNQGTCTEG